MAPRDDAPYYERFIYTSSHIALTKVLDFKRNAQLSIPVSSGTLE